MFVDIHSHKFAVDDIGTVIYNVPIAKADTIFCSDMKGFFSVGFHPWYLDVYSAELMDMMKMWTDDSRLIAIGECGLDKNSKFDIERQIEIFEKQINLSESKHKPLIIHCVGCYNELFDLRKRRKPQQLWIIHGFRGKPQLAEQALKAGCSLSFGEHFNEDSVRITPIDNLYIETDESDMPIGDIYEKIAMVKKCAVEDLCAGRELLKKHSL
ncbi:hypothetical protein D0T49_06360 [Paludibacter sp. 221]|uniref:TatD family hydrolase n=1 Tax=Paludibacter sp. 221 TaxID=2302939 RepID=UPI0013CF54B8|nr:TatD family hydrolase [Paludibacter sp. 221]NDV46666.1 hypothetical protein [Paludibacter sp. 221]